MRNKKELDVLKSYKELDVWRRSFDLCKPIYILTKELPQDERFGLTAQLRRAAVSIPSNIAEGYGRHSRKDYIRYLWMANGSLLELETQTLLLIELGYATPASCGKILREIGDIERMIRALIKALEEKA